MPPQDQPRKTCFVIAPIGEEGTDIRRRSDQVLRHIIEPATRDCGYDAIRADSISTPGIITSQIIQHLVNDKLVVADIAGRNPNVFYELAIRHAVRKPIVQITQVGEPIPFDVAAMRVIELDHRDMDSVAHCRGELIKQIRASERDPKDIITPISNAIDLQLLRRSDNPLEKSNAQIVSLLQSLHAKMDSCMKMARPPASSISGSYESEVITQLRNTTRELQDRLTMESHQRMALMERLNETEDARERLEKKLEVEREVGERLRKKNTKQNT